MSWNASGTVEGETGERDFAENLSFSPPREELDEAPDAQVMFGLETIGEAFARGVIDGKYSCSMHGHDNPDQDNDRKSFGLSLSPTS